MKFLSFMQESDGSYSFGRVWGSCTMSSSIIAFLYLLFHNHAAPDAGTTLSLAGWGIHPFLATKGISATAAVIRPEAADKL